MNRAPLIWLLEASPRDPATGAIVPVRLAGGGTRGFNQFGHTDWRAGLERPPAIIQRLGFNDGEFGDGALIQAVEMRWGGTAKRAAALAGCTGAMHRSRCLTDEKAAQTANLMLC
jgi:hypothetical protein